MNTPEIRGTAIIQRTDVGSRSSKNRQTKRRKMYNKDNIKVGQIDKRMFFVSCLRN